MRIDWGKLGVWLLIAAALAAFWGGVLMAVLK